MTVKMTARTIGVTDRIAGMRKALLDTISGTVSRMNVKTIVAVMTMMISRLPSSLRGKAAGAAVATN